MSGNPSRARDRSRRGAVAVGLAVRRHRDGELHGVPDPNDRSGRARHQADHPGPRRGRSARPHDHDLRPLAERAPRADARRTSSCSTSASTATPSPSGASSSSHRQRPHDRGRSRTRTGAIVAGQRVPADTKTVKVSFPRRDRRTRPATVDWPRASSGGRGGCGGGCVDRAPNRRSHPPRHRAPVIDFPPPTSAGRRLDSTSP